MNAIRLGDFTAGAVYEVDAAGALIHLALGVAEPLPESGRDGGSFRLEFLGPSDPVLPQAIYRLSQGDATYDIFIVPIGRDATGVRYEAIFG